VITRGRTLSELLRADGVSPQSISQIARALKGHFNFRRAKPGHSFRLVRDRSGHVLEFRYHLSPTRASRSSASAASCARPPKTATSRRARRGSPA
jgi:hypothetical protein